MDIINIVDYLPKHSDKTYSKRDKDPETVVIHHTGSPVPSTIKSIAEYHINRKDWAGIGYHYVIGPDGKIFKTNDEETISRHAEEVDDEALGICLIGDFSNDPPKDAQITSAKWLIEHLGLPPVPHRSVSNTECPGNTWESWWDRILPGEEVPYSWKGGLHFQGRVEESVGDYPGTHEWQELIKTPGMMVKQIDAHKYGVESPAPDIRWICRLFIGGDHVDAEYMWQGARGADAMWENHILPALRQTSPDGNPANSWLYTVTWGNEPPVHKWDFIPHFNEFNIRAAELIHDIGKPALLGEISVGQPPFSHMPRLIPSTNAADIWGVHAYGAPTMMTAYDDYALRYKWWVKTIHDHGGENPLWYLSEVGIDGGVINEDHPNYGQESQDAWFKHGWRDWEKWNTDRGRPTFKEQLLWFNDQVQEEYVIGWCPFMSLIQDDHWLSFDINGEWVSWISSAFRENGYIHDAPDPSPSPIADVNETIREAAWEDLGVPFNKESAFSQAARKHELGAPKGSENNIVINDINYRYQLFSMGVVWAQVGEWEDVHVVRY